MSVPHNQSYIPSSYMVHTANLPSTDWQYLEMYGRTFATSSGVIEPITEKYSLQSLVETIYVREGNDLLATAMGHLQTALSTAQGALSVLTDLQTLHNKIAIPSTKSFASTFPFNFGLSNQTFVVQSWKITSTRASTNGANQIITVPYEYTVFREPPSQLPTGTTVTGPTNHTFKIDNADSYRSVYNTLASTYYVPIDPKVVGNLTTMTGYLSDMATIKTKLVTYMSALRNLPVDLRSGAVPLLTRLQAVFSALPAQNSSAFEKWILDGNTLHGVAGVQNAGVIQRDINTAITAAESLNSAQNQVVRKFTFQFQQYMQSAAAILTALNQIYRSMASNISRT